MNTFRRFSLSIILLCGFPFLAGCSTELNLATGREESLMYGTEKEVKIGDAVSRQMAKNYKINTDVDINERVQTILSRLAPFSDRSDLVYFIKVIDEDDVNAVSIPGGYIYIFKGLLDKVKSDDELAGVVAHELGHITAKHGLKRLQGAYGYTLLQALAFSSGSSAVAKGVSAAYATMFYAYSQEDEFEADRLAVKYTRLAGYDAQAMRNVLLLLKEEDKRSRRRLSYFRTHPYINERIAALNAELSGRIEFRDYLNLTGKESGL